MALTSLQIIIVYCQIILIHFWKYHITQSNNDIDIRPEKNLFTLITWDPEFKSFTVQTHSSPPHAFSPD